MILDHAISIADLQRMAQKRLPRMAYDFIEGGCDDELGIAENEAAFGNYRLAPRYCVDVSQRNMATEIAGQAFAIPLGIAPTGTAAMFRHDADRLLASEAAAANVPFILSTASNASIEEAVKAAPNHTWFQLYGARDVKISEDMVRRAADLGVKTLVLSVDVPVHSNRERNQRNGFAHPLKVTPSMIFQAITHPAWAWEYFGNGGLPYMGNFRPYATGKASPSDVADFFVGQFPSPGLTWSFVELVRRQWRGKLFVKGILHPDDAIRAVEIGVDGIIVSNHGGRQLDRAISSIDAFPFIKAAVGEKAEMMLDGGIRRGSDIVIALCLGARFVFAGRATLYGAAAGGRVGIRKALDIFTRELGLTLGQIGCPNVRDLGPQFLLRTRGTNSEATRELTFERGSRNVQGSD
jgi:L-lactate dehydrogenase (cytochrome)/(S)-mandelate dehydrogenase